MSSRQVKLRSALSQLRILDAESRDGIFRGGPIIALSASRCQQGSALRESRGPNLLALTAQKLILKKKRDESRRKQE
ncbi:unnamed protein product [Caenorhabditis auriculariae]|uniref:Uncharacterized protein n=1 Tax=Caenorhabditis auriculariae TaxID=2777116 RepID=A0A8S1HK22_9PELO|nr:unnamed protein product [Caenorhabditis auriculariae]